MGNELPLPYCSNIGKHIIDYMISRVTHKYGIVFGRILITSIDGNEDIVQGFDSALPTICSTLQWKYNRFNAYIDKYR